MGGGGGSCSVAPAGGRRSRPPAREPMPVHERSRHLRKVESNHTMTAPSAPSGAAPSALSVPAAQVHFPPEDRAEILSRIDQALATGQLTLGAIGRELEERFAAHHGAKHAVAVSSVTSAIEI